LVALALYQRWPGLNPPSLWLDDLWVAVLAKDATLSGLLWGKSPCPPGFVILLKVLRAVAGQEPWVLQALPLAASLAQPALMAWLVWRVTGSVAAAVAGAALAAANPTLAAYSLRVKAFSLDGLVTLGLLIGAVGCARAGGTGRLAVLACAAVAALPFSFPSLFVSMALVNAVLWQRVRAGTNRGPTLAVAAGFNAAMLATFAVVVQGRVTKPILMYWTDYYLPASSLANACAFMAETGRHFVTGACHGRAPWLALAIPVGLYTLARRGHKAVAAGLVLFYAGMVAVSAAKLYPLGTGRTDLFGYPLSAFLAVLGLWTLLRRVPAALWLGAAAALALMGHEQICNRVTYPYSCSRAVMERANETVQPGDALVVYPWANWAAGYYGRWPTELVDVDDSTNGFYVHLDRPRTCVLHETHGGVNFQADARVVWLQVHELLARPADRVVYAAASADVQPHRWIVEAILSHGYEVRLDEPYKGGRFMVFTRRPGRGAARR